MRLGRRLALPTAQNSAADLLADHVPEFFSM
jgi:hypothetical protein